MRVPDWFEYDVSRETLNKLSDYQRLILHWSKKINLISKYSAFDIEDRHIWDSAQIFFPTREAWLDIGSGGGLPGIVLAILAQDHEGPKKVTLIESDQRKCVFLRACVRELDLPAEVIAGRIQDVPPEASQFISSRALADLETLFEMSIPHLVDGGTCIFMKGASWREEVEKATANWRFSWEATKSKTDPRAAVLKIRDIERV